MTYAKPSGKISWYYAPGFLLFWLILFFAIIMPVFFYLPDGLDINSESLHNGEFIAERAERILINFDLIGIKVVGSNANENTTVQLLKNEIDKIVNVMHEDLFELELDVQQVSGAYIHWTMVNMYQGLQNIVVKLSPINTTSESYLLVNSHFDSKHGSPGAGDDGAMVVVMLEVLRVLATIRQTFHHPIVFLFNGAEENPLQASHGFITQHKWAKNCKAVLNLDSAGSGNREILFQSGPNNPWLMDYYNKHAKRPFATTIAEELFQTGIIQSDTDFRIFRDFGKIPGLDMAHSFNGYVYHTAFDKFNIIPRGTLQNTGDNVLALVRAFSNASEMIDPSQYASGHTVFYDFLGALLIYYSETQGVILNVCIAVATLLVVVISLWLVAANSYVSLWKVCRAFLLILFVHSIGIILTFGLPILIGVIFDSNNCSMTWYTNKWLILGLYVTPALIGLCLPTLLYLSFTRHHKLSESFRLQMILHAHSVVLAVICIVLTAMSIRSTYLLMITLIFYVSSVILNLLTTLYRRGYYWIILLVMSQMLPFIYFTYIFHALLLTLIPMMGRFGTTTNPELYVGSICALCILLAVGFVIPILNVFRRAYWVLLSLAIVVIIFIILAITPIGFPYRPKTNVGRINFLHVKRTFYQHDGSISYNDSGFYFDFQDRLMEHSVDSHVNLSNLRDISDDCNKYMMCGMPIFNHRWYKMRMHAKWLPSNKTVAMPGSSNLTLINRTSNIAESIVQYAFELSGPPHMSIFIDPLGNTTIANWSFIRDMLDQPDTCKPPFHIFFSYGNDKSPLKFSIEIKKNDSNLDVPLFELGISTHYLSDEHKLGNSTKEFIASFPNYIHVMAWPSSYERYIF